MTEYFGFTETHLSHLESVQHRLVPFVNTFDAKCGKRIGFVGLNSAWMCRKSPDEKTIIAIGEFQVKTAMKQLKGEVDLQVVLFHHPLDWLWPVDRKICRTYLNNSILLSGHLHDVEAGYHRDLYGSIYQFQTQWRGLAVRWSAFLRKSNYHRLLACKIVRPIIDSPS
jgi:hypothetical protein